jgi:hypothetical protein
VGRGVLLKQVGDLLVGKARLAEGCFHPGEFLVVAWFELFGGVVNTAEYARKPLRNPG